MRPMSSPGPSAPAPTPSEPAIPLAEPDLRGNEAPYLAECVESGFVSSVGPFVQRFESLAADAALAPGAVATASGTAALLLSLRAVGVRPGDLVAMPAYTFIATANAADAAGAEPWLFDIDDRTWTLDPGQLADALRRGTPGGRRLGAIVPVHTLGVTPDLDAIAQIARTHGVPVVADCAAAHGATLAGRPITDAADLACYSFNGNKTATAGGGGAITGRDRAVLDAIRHRSAQARVGEGYDHDERGFNHRMTNLQAAVGCAQLERLPEMLAAKRAVRARYDAAFAGLPHASVFPEPRPWDGCWLSGLVLDRDAAAVCAALREHGVGARTFWKPLHLQRPYSDAPREDLARSESLWARVATLPCSSHLTREAQERVIDAVRGVLTAPDAPAPRRP